MENKKAEYRRRYKEKLKLENPEKFKRIKKDSSLKTKYGISIEDYECQIESQGGKCKACNIKFKDPKTTHVDCGGKKGIDNLRGILCVNCNMALGHVKENIDTLNGLINYIKRFQNE